MTLGMHSEKRTMKVTSKYKKRYFFPQHFVVMKDFSGLTAIIKVSAEQFAEIEKGQKIFLERIIRKNAKDKLVFIKNL